MRLCFEYVGAGLSCDGVAMVGSAFFSMRKMPGVFLSPGGSLRALRVESPCVCPDVESLSSTLGNTRAESR